MIFLILFYLIAKVFYNLNQEYLRVTPDRSLVFTCMDYFVPMVRKASIKHSELPVVIDLCHASTADFTTAYVRENVKINVEVHLLMLLTIIGPKKYD